MTCKDCIHSEICEKLNQRLKYSVDGIPLEQIDCDYFKDETKIIEVPCKVGDKCYSIWQGLNDEPQVKEDTIYRIIDIDINNRKVLYETYYVYGKVGEEIFLTEEEAEAKMKEKSNA